MQKNEYREFRRLRNDGWLVGDESVVRWNAGGESESLKHMTVKQLAATACLRNGYSIGTEVGHEKDERGERGSATQNTHSISRNTDDEQQSDYQILCPPRRQGLESGLSHCC